MSFTDAMRDAGLYPRDVVADGKWRRCPTAHKPKKKNGAYMLTPDGKRGYFKDYAAEAEWNVWREDCRITCADQQRHEAQLQALRVQEARRRAAAITAMRAYWQGLPSLRGGHPYLDAKGLSMRGCERLRVDGELLVIPMFVGANVTSLQTITPGGQKRYRAGCPVSGASFLLERKGATVTAFAEGFATSLALYQAAPQVRVVVCFDAGNLVKVAQVAKPRGMAVVCADNDHTGSINTGVEKGRQAAEAIRCGLAYPEGIQGTDWADALLEWGPARVRIGVMRGARMVVPP